MSTIVHGRCGHMAWKDAFWHLEQLKYLTIDMNIKLNTGFDFFCLYNCEQLISLNLSNLQFPSSSHVFESLKHLENL
jgi:hypothetical protein